MTDIPSRFPVAVDPTLRPRQQRRGARVLLIDDHERMLLFEDSDPLVPGSRWWMTPGGGIDPGESDIAAAVRELAEETGLVVTADLLQGPIARQVAVHGYADRIVEQTEVFYLLRVPAFEVDIAGYTDEEKITHLQFRWWSRPDLAATAEWIWPAQLLDLWAVHDRADLWPVDLGHQEQSSVPV